MLLLFITQSCPTLCNPMNKQPVRLPCPSLSPEVCSNLCPLRGLCLTHSIYVSCFLCLVLFIQISSNVTTSVFDQISAFEEEMRLRGFRFFHYLSHPYSDPQSCISLSHTHTHILPTTQAHNMTLYPHKTTHNLDATSPSPHAVSLSFN